MVESEANVLSEEVMLGAVMFGHEEFQPVIDAVAQLAEKAGKPIREHVEPDHSDLEKKVVKLVGKDIEKAYKISDKQERSLQKRTSECCAWFNHQNRQAY